MKSTDDPQFQSDLENAFAVTALDQARGEAEIRAAAIDLLLGGLLHDEPGHKRLVELATLCRVDNRLSHDQARAVDALRTNDNDSHFDDLLAAIRAALQKLPAEFLKREAERQIREEERPPMQFALDGAELLPPRPPRPQGVDQVIAAQLRKLPARHAPRVQAIIDRQLGRTGGRR